MKAIEKLKILSDAAKYDVSCSTSGVSRKNKGKIGNAKACGICHAWSSDGRCISLLKVLLTNYCVYDCAYCVNRLSNDVARASFTAREVADLTIQFYRRNYIEGLFLSSAIEKNPNHTMEKIYEAVRILRTEYGFSGYIHVKAIPGADPILIQKTGFLVDRMSVNIELPTEKSLRLLAPQKNPNALVKPMKQIQNNIIMNKDDAYRFKNVDKFVPGGQSTQMIIGATGDTDQMIINTTQKLYNNFQLKRVYYSAYMPVNKDQKLPALNIGPPLKREHRLYQADWLLRFYKFSADELLTNEMPNFDLDFDPKMIWALRNLDLFPMEINKVSYEELLRVPGIGVKSAYRIVKQRRLSPVKYEDLKKIGVVVKRAKYFITCNHKFNGLMNLTEENIRHELLVQEEPFQQLTLFN